MLVSPHTNRLKSRSKTATCHAQSGIASGFSLIEIKWGWSWETSQTPDPAKVHAFRWIAFSNSLAATDLGMIRKLAFAMPGMRCAIT